MARISAAGRFTNLLHRFPIWSDFVRHLRAGWGGACGKNVLLVVREDGKIRKNPLHIRGLTFLIRGENNYIEIHEPYQFCNVRMVLESNTSIRIHSHSHIRDTSIEKKHGTGPNAISIGKNFCCRGGTFSVSSGGGDLRIGDDCIFSMDIAIRSSDAHTALDVETGRMLNEGQEVLIGNHVWMGMGVTLLKRARIPDHSIVGARAVVTRPFFEKNIAIGGNPARVLRRGVDWRRESTEVFKKMSVDAADGLPM